MKHAAARPRQGSASGRTSDLSLALDEAEAFRRALLEANVGAVVKARLAQLGASGRDMQDPEQHDRLRENLLQDIRSGRALSLIRLGDGEGNTLFWRAHAGRYPALARLCMGRIWAVMFGGQAARASQWDALGGHMANAVRNATYLGVPTPLQYTTALAEYTRLREPRFDLRGQTGIVAVWDWLASHPGVGAADRSVVVNWHVHKSLLNFYGELVRAAGNVSVITCYPALLPALQQSCGVQDGEAWLIPPQAVNINGTPTARHFPTVFDRIMADIGSRKRQGQLVLVGAGLPGKAYCEAVRRAGGMAIDVGSLMDVWVGQGVRPYHSTGFVAAHRIGSVSSAGTAAEEVASSTRHPTDTMPDSAQTSATRNEIEIQVFGLRRSGNHALLAWLMANLSKPAHFLNNVDPFTDPFIGFHNATLPNTVPIQKPMTEAEVEALRAAAKHCLVYSYEHLPLGQLRQRPLLADHDAMVGRSGRTQRLLILRDFWNWMASRSKQFLNRGVEDPQRLLRHLAHETTLWKQYAREFEGDTQLIERDGFVTVKYNEFVASPEAREKLLTTLGLPVRTLSIDYVPDLGLGSSFDGTAYSGQAQKMDVVGRWKYLAQEPLLSASLATWRADDELLALNERLFGLRDPFAAPARPVTAPAPSAARVPDARQLLLSLLPQGSRGAEIGVHLGDFSARLLQAVQPRELLLIDPWLLVDDAPRRNSWYGAGRLGQQGMDDRHASVLKRFAPEVAEGRVRVLREMSTTALAALPDGELDWVYIDGDHRYEGVRDDLALALAKVRDGGLICGDDYTLGSWWKDGVVRAVNEFIGRERVRVVFFMAGQFVLEKLPMLAPRPAVAGVPAMAPAKTASAEPCVQEDLSGTSPRLLLIFGGIAGGMGMPPFEFVKAAGALDARRIFLRDPAQAWYQFGLPTIPGGLTGLADYIRRQIEASGAQDVRFVGNSMGGYAALMMCALVGTGSAIVFAPQTQISAASREAMGDRRWSAQLSRLHGQLPADAVLDLPDWLARQRPDLRAEVHVSTTDALDLRHAEALAGLPGVHIHRHAFAGHNLVRALRDQGRLPALLLHATA